MSEMVHQRVLFWVILAVLLGGISWMYLRTAHAPEIPRADLATMETRVREAILADIETLRSDPDQATAWAALAQTYHAHDLFGPAVEAYQQAMQRNDGDSRWPYLAALATTKSDPQAAVPLFERAVALQPANASVYINFGDVLLRLGRPARAEEVYQQALLLDEQSSHARYGLAQVAMANGQLENALSLLEAAEQIAPRHGEVHALLSQVYQRLERPEQALQQQVLARAWPDSTRAPDPTVQAMESRAVDAQSVVRRGVALAQRGAFAEAEAAFREALAIRPGNARDYANLGGALAGQGKIDEAIAAYQQGLALEPEDADTLNNLGFTLLQQGHLDEAESRLLQALELAPSMAPVLGNLGLLAHRRQQPAAAIQYFRDALELDPGLLFARKGLAEQFAASGDTAAAAEQWRFVLEIDPADLSTRYNLAIALMARGEHADAVRHLRRGLEIAPNSSRLVTALAWELATAPDDEVRDGAEALSLAGRLYESYPGRPETLDTLAAALAESGEFDKAVQVMEQVVKMRPDAAAKMRLATYRSRRPWRQALR